MTIVITIGGLMTEPRKVSKGLLKAKMLEYFREIERTGKELIITDNNRPVIKITAINQKNKTVDDVFKKYKNKVKYMEDINTPTKDEWEES
jgi:antitoxin (DNA-binding transcriptional repressor) of toxin-antitoxin stability system